MTLNGVLSGIFIARASKSLESTRVKAVNVLDNGLQRDKHQSWFRKADARAKRYKKGTLIWNSRQISVVSEEDLALIARDLRIDKIEPEWLGANLCVKGIQDLSLLKPRTKIFIPNENKGDSEVGLYITAPNKPCMAPVEVIMKYCPQIKGYELEFVKAALSRRGVVAVVEHGGVISEGAEIAVVIQD